MLKRVVVGFGLILAGSGAAYAGPFQNGSFESNAYNGGSNGFETLYSGDTSITGWTVGGNSVDLIGSYWEPANGTFSLDMSGNNAGSISQTFDTVANDRYSVTFDLAGNPTGGPAVKELMVSADGTSGTYTFDTSSTSTSDMGWELETFTFIATGSESTLTFTSLTDTAYGPALDNVSVSDIPEPASAALFGVALLGLGFTARRRA